MDQLMERMRNLLEDREEIVFAYLFGSHSRGTANPLSDIDIAVFLDTSKKPGNEMSYGYKSNLLQQLQSVLGKKADVIVLNNAPILLCFNVLKDGKLLFAKSELERVRFHREVLRKHMDFKPILNIQKYYLRKRLKEGTFGGGQIGRS
ncbi:MAG: type VII toxin-antitoxin system MntA family adenylyltransferase antitoxin [Bacillota bacterium]